MLWFKRNLAWVLAILVAVIATGAGGYYIWNGKSRNDDLTQKLEQQKAELNRLTTEVKPSPTPENVRAAREDVRKSQEYAAMARKLFVPTTVPNLNNQSYGSLLQTNLAALRRLAAVSGVDISSNYSFSFEPQTHQMTFQPQTLRPLAEQLTEISEVCEALFKARIHRLDQVRRVAVSQYDTASSEILQNAVIATNRFTGLWVWPYEFGFECFSTELASALEELNRIPRMLVVKTIRVEAEAGAAPPPPPPPPAGGPQPPMDPRRRMPNRPGGPPGTPPPKVATTLTTVLQEGLLHVVVQVHVIKPVK